MSAHGPADGGGVSSDQRYSRACECKPSEFVFLRAHLCVRTRTRFARNNQFQPHGADETDGGDAPDAAGSERGQAQGDDRRVQPAAGKREPAPGARLTTRQGTSSNIRFNSSQPASLPPTTYTQASPALAFRIVAGCDGRTASPPPPKHT